MNAFPQLSEMDIDNIIAYTDYTPPAVANVAANNVQAVTVSSNSLISNEVILSALLLVLTILIVMLVLVNKTLKKIAIASGVELVKKEIN